MINITYIEFDGTVHSIAMEAGSSVMQGAVQNGVKGMSADCGGACACPTCHVHIDPQWLAAAGAPSETETDLLDCVEHLAPNSRLSCQIKITGALDGMIVRMPGG